MNTQRTLSILKPDATARNITGRINSLYEDAGLRIIAQKRIRMSKPQARGFYAEHENRPFFDELVEFMTSGPVVVQILEGHDAINLHRKLMGATNPNDADEGTVRKMFARSVGENSVHGSDSTDSAKREIDYFFNDDEITG